MIENTPKTGKEPAAKPEAVSKERAQIIREHMTSLPPHRRPHVLPFFADPERAIATAVIAELATAKK